MGILSNLIVRLGADVAPLVKDLNRAKREFKTFGDNVTTIGQQFSLAISLPVIALGTVAVQSAAKMDSLQRGLTAVMNSSEAASREMQRLKEVAKLPGLGFAEAVQGSIRLQAAGISANDAARYLQVFGNALATVGKGRADLEAVTTQLTQMANKPKVLAEDLKPLIERVPQVAALLRREFGTVDTEVLQSMGISGRQMVDTLVFHLGKLPAATGGVANDFENLKDTLEQASASIGRALIPTVQAIIPKIVSLAEFAGQLGERFIALPKPVQDTALALGALLVALPLAVSGVGLLYTNIGQLAGALAKLIPILQTVAVAQMTGMTGALKGAEVAVLRLGQAAAVAAAAFAGWKLGTWAYEQIPAVQKLGDALGGLVLKVPGAKWALGIAEAEQGAAKASALLEESTNRLAASLRAKGVVVERGTLTLQQWNRQLIEAARKSVPQLASATAVATASTAAFVLQKKAAAERVRELQTALVAIHGQYLKGNATAKDVADAQTALNAAIRATKIDLDGAGDGHAKVESAAKKHRAAVEELGQRYPQVMSDLLQSTITLSKSYADARREFEVSTVAIIVPLRDRIPEAVLRSLEALKSLQDGLQAVGEIGQQGLARALAAGKQYFDGLNDALRSLKTTDVDAELAKAEQSMRLVTEAFDQGRISLKVYTQAQVGLLEAKAAAGVITREEIAQLEALKAATESQVKTTERATKSSQKAWQAFGKQVSTIVTDLSRGIADAIVSGEKMGKVFERVARSIASSLIRYVIEGGIKQVGKELDKLNISLGSIFGNKPGIIKNATSSNPVTHNAGWDVPKGPSGASSAAGGLGGFAGAANMVTGAVSAISAVVGNFQMAHMNTALGRIEESTRKTWIITGEQQDSIFATVRSLRDEALTQTQVLRAFERNGLYINNYADLEGILRRVMGTQSGGGGSVTNNFSLQFQGITSAEQMADEFMRFLKSKGVRYA